MNSIKANEGYDEIEAFNSSLVPSEIKSSGIIGIGSEYSFEEWKSFLQSKGVNATDQEFQAFWDDWGADEDMEKSQFEESKTTETTESEKATEIKEEFSENAYLQLINETTPVPMEFHGRYYNSAEEWKEHDPIAFTESYLAWIDGNEKDGVDTGDDGYEAKASEKETDDYEVDVDEYIKTGEPVEKLPKDKRSYNVELKANEDSDMDHDQDSDFKYHGWEEDHEELEPSVKCGICGAVMLKSEYADKKLGGELKAKEDFGQFTIQNPNVVTDGYPTDEEGFARASWEDSEIEHRKRWLIKAGFSNNAEDDAWLPYFSLPTMVRAVLAQDLHVGGIQAMGESKAMWGGRNTKASELATTIEDMKYDDEPMRSGDGHGILEDPLYPESTRKEEPKLDTEEDVDNYIKEGTDPAPYDEEDMPETIKSELKDEADEIIGAMGMADDLMDTYGSSPNADPTTTPLEDHSGTDDSSDTQLDTVDAQQETSAVPEDTVEESFGDCGCKDTKKARMTWESAIEGDKQYWLRNMGEDEGYSYYHFEHLPKRVGESLVDKFKIEESEDRGWSKIPALERADLLKKLGFPPRDAELVANLEYPQLSESLKKDVNDAVGVKKKAEESKREKPDDQLVFENDLYSNMYDGYLQRRGERVDSKKNNKF